MKRLNNSTKQLNRGGRAAESTGQQEPSPVLLYAGRFADSRDTSLHSHDGIEVVLVSEGRCTIEVSGTALAGGPGVLYVLPGSVPHIQFNRVLTRTTFIVFQAAQSVYPDTARTLDVSAEPWVGRWVEEILDLKVRYPEDYESIAEGILAALVRRLRRMERSHGDGMRRHPALVRAVDYVDRNLATPFTVRDVASCACVSPSYLTSLFRREYGCGPLGYVQRRKMGLARRLLADPYLTVAQVGAACGYDDANYFSRMYRKVYGNSPTRDRAQA
jgi:AraC-like DNA-binding protein